MARVKNGEHAAVQELRHYLRRDIHCALHAVFGRRQSDHEDLFHEAFQQVMLTICRGSFEQKCALRTWARRVTAKCALNAARSRHREARHVDRSMGGLGDLPSRHIVSGPSLHEQLEVREMVHLLQEELRCMNKGRARTVVLFHLEGYNIAEIGKLTGVSVSAAQSRLVRGRKELQDRIAARLGGAVQSPRRRSSAEIVSTT